jgi:hypothetical protein
MDVQSLYNFLNPIGRARRKKALKEGNKRLARDIENDMLDNFLEHILKMMGNYLFIDTKFRRNIKDFKARYTFKDRKGRIAASVIFQKHPFFKHDQMIVKEDAIKNTNVTVIFKDGKALKDFLFSGDPDVFDFVLGNKLRFEGNLNYIFKFTYMVRHLQLAFNLR